MNASELIAWEYLKRKGIVVADNTLSGTPDFVGKRNYEVKKLYKNKIIIYDTQKARLRGSIIIVVEGRGIVEEIPFEKLHKKYKIITVKTTGRKHIKFYLGDDEYEKVLKEKGKRTWQEFVMDIVKGNR